MSTSLRASRSTMRSVVPELMTISMSGCARRNVRSSGGSRYVTIAAPVPMRTRPSQPSRCRRIASSASSTSRAMRAARSISSAPGGSGIRLLAEPLDELEPEPLLELADLQAHGRLGEVEPARRGGEAAEPHDLDERVQLVEVQAAHVTPADASSISKIYSSF